MLFHDAQGVHTYASMKAPETWWARREPAELPLSTRSHWVSSLDERSTAAAAALEKTGAGADGEGYRSEISQLSGQPSYSPGCGLV